MEAIKMPLPKLKVKSRRGRLIGLVALALLICGGLVFWLGGGPVDLEARVDGHIASLAAGVDGRVGKVLVQENQLVKAGETLILLEDAYLAARLAEARARFDALRMGASPELMQPGGLRSGSAVAEDAIRARMQAYRDQENAARRDVEQLSTDHAKALLEARRLEAQGGSSSPSRDRVNKARLAELGAREKLDAAQRMLEAVSRARASSDGELVRYRAELAALARMPQELRESQLAVQQARVRAAEQDLASAVIVSPVDGQVARIDVAAGAPVRRGQALAVVLPILPADLRISAHFTAAEVDKMKLGDSCTVTFPDSPELKLTGIVESIANASAEAVPPAHDSAEALRPRSGIPVRIAIPDYKPEGMPLLRVGMKAKVKVGLFF